MPDHFENNLGHIVFDNVNIATDYLANTANTVSNTIHDWITNTYNEWNPAQESITYRDAAAWSRASFRRAQPNWSEVFREFESVSEDIEEENELLDEFLNEFVVKGDDDK